METWIAKAGIRDWSMSEYLKTKEREHPAESGGDEIGTKYY